MDPKLAADLQRDRQWEATPEDAHREQIDGRLTDLHTLGPGIIESFDAGTQTAKVQPAIKRLFTERGWLPLPVCVDCPVIFPAGGDFVLTFPVRAGDECVVFWSERAIDNWWDRGGVQEPAEYRLHDLSDGFALVGVSSRPRFLGSVATDAVELRTRSGTVLLRGEADGTVYVGGKGGDQPALLGTAAETDMATLLTALGTYVTGIQSVADPGSPPGTLTGPLLTKITDYLAGASARLATKAKVR